MSEKDQLTYTNSFNGILKEMYTKNEKDKIKFLQKKNMNKIREEKDRKQ